MATLISSQFYFPSLVHEKAISFFSIVIRGFTMVARLGINLLTKFILPRKHCKRFLCLGRERETISSIPFGSIVRQYLDTIFLINFPWLVANTHLLRFKDIPYSLHLINTCMTWPKWSDTSFEYTVISSRYTNTNLSIMFFKGISIFF